MFDFFSWQHLSIMLIVALVVVGPKDLPRLMNMAGKWAGKARAMAGEFRRSFDEMARESELAELRKEIDDLKKNNPVTEVANTMSGVQADIGNPMEGAPHTFGEYFNTSVVQRPSQGTLTQRSNGNAPKVTLYNPGVFNMDTALFKNFPIHNRVAVQIRAETYNTLNHPEFNGFDSAAKFSKPDASGNSTQTNSTFGQLNDSAGPRTMQLALRINF